MSATPAQPRFISLPLVRATTFPAESAEAHRDLFASGAANFYQRFGHVTLAPVERELAELEGAESALLCSAGMGAIATALFTVLKPGDHAIAHQSIFAQTEQLLRGPLASYGIETTFLDARDLDAVAGAVRPNTRAIYAETPTNPLLDILDLEGLGEIARRGRFELLVDSTFASPVLQQPLAHGATLVLHSGTKYLGGHSDVMCGVAAGRQSLIRAIRDTQILIGTVLAPDAAWLLWRSLRTLSLRVERQSASALLLAARLRDHPAVAEVRYPWLEGTLGAIVGRRQMKAGGGVVTFRVKGDAGAGRKVLNALRRITIATSLGGVETLAELPFDLDFAEEGAGSDDGRNNFIRLAVGLEEPDQLWADLSAALGSVIGRR